MKAADHWNAFRRWARLVKRDVLALWLAARDDRVPLAAKWAAAAVAAYALSPIDLIPDAIPVLGLLDDLIIVPAGILGVVALIPDDVMADLRRQADSLAERPVSRTGAAIIVALWLATAGALGWWWLG
ncbi:hypothetical protein HDIA_4783 [Hartmannibacter diazotrophicus]|uniref:DUF1232 domain-containing protein n=1 Tax=Hartmannibacter diazotrophicus TaxID=1482074 RepID=A0A2C9DDD2_9HYPH|nr:DUF1232 domain-containing protein [Hartmannibacter diazotrophicus]SON58324.1 hypothetical protein HDIA_4783 [Hartmannibacter diazotrophicus]